MFKLVNPLKRKSVLDESVSIVADNLIRSEPGTEEYDALLANMERLINLQSEEQSRRVSPDTLAVIAANLVGILIIVGYEQGHVTVSRAFGSLLKTKHQS
jgi:hypothetical protein